jgi:hypothetical protein
MANRRRILLLLGGATYAILFILIALFVFIENDESKPLSKIWDLNYLIPAMVYSIFALWVSFGLFLLLKKSLNRSVSFPLSLMFGIPAGLILLSGLLRWVTNH